VPHYTAGGYNQFNTPYPKYGASVPVTPFPCNHAQHFPTYPPIPPSIPRDAPSAYRLTTKLNPTLIKDHPRPLSAHRDEPYIPETRPPLSHICREDP
jgi:hypothetical protein